MRSIDDDRSRVALDVRTIASVPVTFVISVSLTRHTSTSSLMA
jgi:hypothetical protein